MKKYPLYWLIWSFALIFLVTATGEAQNKSHEGLVYPPLNQPQPPVPDRVELDNGMIVYLLEDHELPIIDISVQIRTGSLYEPADKVGLAAITGAVMRTGGTTSRTGDELDEILENLAASVETGIGDDSGSASVSVLKEDLDTGLSILADLLMNPAFRGDKIELEKVQHRSGISRRNDNPGAITRREFGRLIYGADSPYARTTEYDTINSITRDDLVAFYQKFFHPNNIILGVLGDFDSETMLAKIQEAFKGWEPAEINIPEKPKVPETYGKKIALVNKEDVNQTNIRMGHIGWLRKNEDYPALVVMSQILGIGFSSRLINSIRVEKGLAYSVGNNYGAGYDVPGVFFIACGTKSEATVTAIGAILAEVEKMRAEEVTDEELKQAIDGFMNSSVFDYDTKGEILSRALRYEYYDYPQDFVEQLMAGIREVTKADVKRVATEYLHPDKFTLIAVGKASDFDKPLSTLGDVTEVDITIPSPSPEPVPEAGEAETAKAKAILADVIEAHGGLDKLKSVKNIITKGKMVMNTPGGMMELDGEVTIVLPAKTRADLSMPAMGMRISRIFDGQSAWMVMQGRVQDLPTAYVEEGKKEIFRDSIPLLAYISNEEVSAQYLGSEEVKGKMADVILISDTPADTLKLFVDQETKHIIKKEFQALTEQGPAEREEFLDDYREVSGVMIAFHTVSFDNGEQSAEITFSEAIINAEVAESLFER
ncbi:insulinase family protein [Candidatus Poribacteria bacterium]|nr:MAG: insulinase family protein [Candidatus Poribacteria bacterium]